MKNLTIEKPTTLIKITKNIKKLKLRPANEFDKGIDFYDSESEIDDSGMFNSFYESKENEDKIHFSKICPFENFSTNITKLQKLIHKPTTLESTKNLDVFLLSSLKFDLRIKNYEALQNNVFVYFYSEIDAISFYKQYYNYFELSFQNLCYWPAFLSETFIENEPTVLHSDKQIPNTAIEDINENIIYGRERFLDTVQYFNNLKGILNKVELQKISEGLSNGSTDFVFKNSKELAVGTKSNKLMQDAIKILSGEEIEILLKHFGYDIAAIAASKHGAYTIQTLLNFSTNESHKKLIIEYFSKEGEYLLAHEIGNYTFQKLLAFDEKLVCEFFLNNFDDVVYQDLGLKVFKKCLDPLVPFKDELLTKLNSYTDLPAGLLIQLRTIISNM